MKSIASLVCLILSWFFVTSGVAQAGVFELGGGYSYSNNSYNGGSFTSTKSYSTTFGYFFTQDSEVEFMYQDTTNQEFVTNVQDITYRDRVYSVNFLYHFMDEKDAFRPYVRSGVGQLNRDATGSYSGGYAPPGRLDQVTVIGGIGFKAKIIGQFGVKGEAISYLVGGGISTWKDNISINFGGSFYF